MLLFRYENICGSSSEYPHVQITDLCKLFDTLSLTHLRMLNGLFYHISLDLSIPNLRGVWFVFRIITHSMWVYTVCKGSIYGTLGLNGLTMPLYRFQPFL